MKHTKRTTSIILISLLSSVILATSASYSVKPGETLWRIAKNHDVSVKELQKVNHLNSHKIYEGQKLIIPTKTSAVSVATADTPKKKKRFYKTHIVREGDSLWAIARKHKISVKVLQKRNGLSSNVIRIGQVLTVSKHPKAIIVNSKKPVRAVVVKSPHEK